MSFLVGISGKIGSGKDYLTEKLTKELQYRGYSTMQTSFAKPLKDELGEIIEDMRENVSLDAESIIQIISDRKDMTEEEAKWLYNLIKPDLDADDTITGWSRTLGVRSCLQVLGTDIRRKKYPNYWTDLFLAYANQQNTDFVFASDGRFPNEMDCVVDNNGLTFRLEIPEDILEYRRTNRDGIVYTPEQLNHISETALDDYDRFDVIVGEEFDESILADLIENKLVSGNI